MTISGNLLDSLLINMVRSTDNKDPALHHFFVLLYYYGLRASEAQQLGELIVRQTEYNTIITAKKTYTQRTLVHFPETINSINYCTNIVHGKNPYSIEQARHYMNKIIGVYHISTGKKECVLHLFRHNYAKKKYIETRSSEVVAIDMSVSNSTAKGYIGSIIKSPFKAMITI